MREEHSTEHVVVASGSGTVLLLHRFQLLWNNQKLKSGCFVSILSVWYIFHKVCASFHSFCNILCLLGLFWSFLHILVLYVICCSFLCFCNCFASFLSFEVVFCSFCVHFASVFGPFMPFCDFLVPFVIIFVFFLSSLVFPCRHFA